MAKLKCFVVMPFRDEFDAVFETIRDAAANAVPGEEIHCHRLKEVHAAGRITDDIIDSLSGAALCVADVTGGNPNVMWETGYAMALNKPTILIGQCVDALPFDLKVHRVLPYSIGDLRSLSPPLAEAIRQTLARYDVRPKATPIDRVQAGSSTVAVTGSMQADHLRASRRVETLLRPFIGSGATWLCGSSGVVDESVLKYLLAQGERVATVGYHRYDLSEAVRELVDAGKLPFLDASVEALPKGLAGPTPRDLLFCMKADLVILFWDGESAGTRSLIQYFTDAGKNLLIGFV